MIISEMYAKHDLMQEGKYKKIYYLKKKVII